MSIPIDDLPNWISAFSSAGALLAAIAAGIIAGRVYSIERRRERIAAVELRQFQARNVSGWIELEASSLTGNTQLPIVKIRNNSDLPVYEVKTFLTQPNMDMVELDTIKVLPPSDDLYSLPVSFDPPNRQMNDADGIGVGIAFVDSSGIRWLRDEYGRLGEIVEDTGLLKKPAKQNYTFLEKSD